MKKIIRYLLVFTSVFCCIKTGAQNLVPNPSFEEYDICPTSLSGALDGNCHSWKAFRVTPDYYNNCSSTEGFNNSQGYQEARTGEAYTGFISYYPNPSREQLGAEFLSALEIGVRYYVSFYVSCAFDSINVATNKIGARFTTYQYYDPSWTMPLPNTCQVYTNEIISDTMNWVKIQGSFIADSAYRYIIIGQFFDDAHIDTLHLPYKYVAQIGYYYVDDVCVSTDPMLCNVDVSNCAFELPSAFTPNSDNVNDEYKWVQNCSNIDEFTMHIYNRWGQMIFSTNDYAIGWNGTYKNEEQPTDVYAVYVSVISDGKKITKSASVTLLR